MATAMLSARTLTPVGTASRSSVVQRRAPVQAKLTVNPRKSSVALSSSKAASFSAFPGLAATTKQRRQLVAATPVTAAALVEAEDPFESAAAKVFGKEKAPAVVTLGFITAWYALNVAFNLQNKTIFNYFPYPWTVSAIHVVVGTIYCALTYLLGAKEASFQRPITKKEFAQIFWPASMHAIGHIAANLSFAAVAISLTHTVKTLEPAFNVVLSQALLGNSTPLPVVGTLIPIMVGVAMASAAELSFNWTGFISAMVSNLTFGFRAVLSKKAMGDIKNLGSTAVYAWTTLISVLICVPLAVYFEGPTLRAAAQAAHATHSNFYWQLLSVGLLYHLYNQFAFNTLQRVSPVSHGVCNVVKRVVIIGTSVIFFGNKLTMQTKIGTAIALVGTWLYTEMSSKYGKPKAAPPPPPAAKPATAT